MLYTIALGRTKQNLTHNISIYTTFAVFYFSPSPAVSPQTLYSYCILDIHYLHIYTNMYVY